MWTSQPEFSSSTGAIGGGWTHAVARGDRDRSCSQRGLEGHNVKFRTSTCAFALAALTSTVAVAASADTIGVQGADTVVIQDGGEWEYRGSDVFTEKSKIFHSGGGDLKVCLSEGSKHGRYQLKEQDTWGIDEIVFTRDGGDSYFWFPITGTRPECTVYTDLNKYRDEEDGQAEFYMLKWTGGNSIVEVYD
jgi:hypothetical protein